VKVFFDTDLPTTMAGIHNLEMTPLSGYQKRWMNHLRELQQTHHALGIALVSNCFQVDLITFRSIARGARARGQFDLAGGINFFRETHWCRL
jgi:hypothetical protein